MGLKVNDKVPLFAVVSRLTSQKGLDLVLEALPGLLEQGATGVTWRGRPSITGRFPRRGGGTSGRWACRLAITKPSRTASWVGPM